MEAIDHEKIEELVRALESSICLHLGTGDPRPMNDAEYDLAAELSRSSLGRDVVKDSLSYASSGGAVYAYSRMVVSARTLMKVYRHYESLRED